MLRLDKLDTAVFETVLSSIKRIEASAYPCHMQMIKDVDCIDDVLEYVEARKVFVFSCDKFYIIATKNEVCDFAAIESLTLKDIFFIADVLYDHFGNKKFSMDARSSTSYKLIRFFEKRGRVVVHSRKEWDWDGEAMLELVVSASKPVTSGDVKLSSYAMMKVIAQVILSEVTL